MELVMYILQLAHTDDVMIKLSFKRLNLSKRDLGGKRVRSGEVEMRPVAVRDCLERADMI